MDTVVTGWMNVPNLVDNLWWTEVKSRTQIKYGVLNDAFRWLAFLQYIHACPANLDYFET